MRCLFIEMKQLKVDKNNNKDTSLKCFLWTNVEMEACFYRNCGLIFVLSQEAVEFEQKINLQSLLMLYPIVLFFISLVP